MNSGKTMQTVGHVEQNYTHNCVCVCVCFVLSLLSAAAAVRMNDVSVYGFTFLRFFHFVVNFP